MSKSLDTRSASANVFAMISRLWLLASLGWFTFCAWGFHDAGESILKPENLAMSLAGFIIRLLVLFVVFGLPRPSASSPRSPRS